MLYNSILVLLLVKVFRCMFTISIKKEIGWMTRKNTKEYRLDWVTMILLTLLLIISQNTRLL